MRYLPFVGIGGKPGLGGEPSGCRWVVPVCCAPSCGRCFKAAAGELKLLLRMVTEVIEIRWARALLDKEVRHLGRAIGHQFAAQLMHAFRRHARSCQGCCGSSMNCGRSGFSSPSAPMISSSSSWLSIGAIPASADRSIRSAAVPSFVLRQIGVAAGKPGTITYPVAGRLLGKPLSAMALLGLGFRNIFSRRQP